MSMESDELEALPVDSKLLKRLLQWLRPYRLLATGAVLVLMLGAVTALVGPAVTQRVLDIAVPNKDAHLLMLLAAAYAGALIVEFVCEYAQTILTTTIGQHVMYDLRLAIFDKFQRLSIPYFDRHPVGRLMTRVTSDVETLNELFSSGVVTVFGDVFALVAVAVMMFFTDWRLTLVAFAVMPVVYVVARGFRRYVRDAFRDIRLRIARLNSYLQEHLSGVRVVQLFGRETAAAQGFSDLNKDHLEAHLRSIKVYAVFFPAVELLTTVSLALLLWYGGLRSLGGTLTVGTLAAFIQLTRRFFQPLQDLSEKFNLLQSAMASSERIFQLLDADVEIPAAAQPVVLPPMVRGEVVFEDVWFRYAPDGPWILKNISFTARPGQTVALVGHTGAGKTTIANLLLRFYEPERGRITIDGVDIRTMSFADLRGLVGYVPQDLFLFAGDLIRNLTLGAAAPEAAMEAARRVGADRYIQRLPGAYGHVLGERGKSLSVGERQLLAFARALTLDSRILVLDEATSSVDAEAEAQIQAALATLLTGRTCLVIAHRLSTIADADLILVLHRGEIRERGTHAELLVAGGLYQRLHDLQFELAPSAEASAA